MNVSTNKPTWSYDPYEGNWTEDGTLRKMQLNDGTVVNVLEGDGFLRVARDHSIRQEAFAPTFGQLPHPTSKTFYRGRHHPTPACMSVLFIDSLPANEFSLILYRDNEGVAETKHKIRNGVVTPDITHSSSRWPSYSYLTASTRSKHTDLREVFEWLLGLYGHSYATKTNSGAELRVHWTGSDSVPHARIALFPGDRKYPSWYVAQEAYLEFNKLLFEILHT